MPFYLSDTDRSEPKVSLEVVDHRRFRLMTSFSYEDPLEIPPGHTGRPPLTALWQVPGKGEVTDLASVPPLLWGWFAPYGRQLLPALLHDHYCGQATAHRPEDGRAAAGLRAHADLLFRRSLREQKMPFARRWLMWAAVSLDGMLEFAKLMFAACVLGALTVSAAVWLLPWRLGSPHGSGLVTAALLAVGPALLGMAVRVSAAEPRAGQGQGRWWAVQRAVTVSVLGGYVLPIAAVLLLVTGLAALVLVPSALPVAVWTWLHKRFPRLPHPPRETGVGPLVVAAQPGPAPA